MKPNFDTVIVAITLAGSLLSSVANGFVLVSFFIYRHQVRTFRHALILNLTIAGKISLHIIMTQSITKYYL